MDRGMSTILRQNCGELGLCETTTSKDTNDMKKLVIASLQHLWFPFGGYPLPAGNRPLRGIYRNRLQKMSCRRWDIDLRPSNRDHTQIARGTVR